MSGVYLFLVSQYAISFLSSVDDTDHPLFGHECRVSQTLVCGVLHLLCRTQVVPPIHCHC